MCMLNVALAPSRRHRDDGGRRSVGVDPGQKELDDGTCVVVNARVRVGVGMPVYAYAYAVPAVAAATATSSMHLRGFMAGKGGMG